MATQFAKKRSDLPCANVAYRK